MRGKLSQTQVNRKLGYEINQIYRWEAGKRAISWLNFEKLTKACKVNLKVILRHEFGYAGRPEDFGVLLKHFIGQTSVSEFAKNVGISRSTLSRWLNGGGTPTLEAFLKVLDRQELLLSAFVSALSPAQHILSLKKQDLQAKLEKNLHYTYPEIGAIMACMELAEYLNSDKYVAGYFAKKIGISVEYEKTILAEMVRGGIIHRDGDKYTLGGYCADMRGQVDGAIRLRRYWIERSLQALSSANSVTEPHRFAYLVFSVSREADEQIREAMYEYFSRLKVILTNDVREKTSVRSVNLQDISVGDIH